MTMPIFAVAAVTAVKYIVGYFSVKSGSMHI